jgi:hypothetical protein
MKETMLEQIKAFINDKGPTEVSRRAKLSRRTLQYIASGRYKPSYSTQQKLLREMAK